MRNEREILSAKGYNPVREPIPLNRRIELLKTAKELAALGDFKTILTNGHFNDLDPHFRVLVGLEAISTRMNVLEEVRNLYRGNQDMHDRLSGEMMRHSRLAAWLVKKAFPEREELFPPSGWRGKSEGSLLLFFVENGITEMLNDEQLAVWRGLDGLSKKILLQKAQQNRETILREMDVKPELGYRS